LPSQMTFKNACTAVTLLLYLLVVPFSMRKSFLLALRAFWSSSKLAGFVPRFFFFCVAKDAEGAVMALNECNIDK